ncbi:MAG: hypothetical protein ACE5NN_01850 [Candidatus Bathyarchaeia archaeon]
MSYNLYKIMTYDKIDVGWEDDSFAEGWGWTPEWVTVTRDGDIIKIVTNIGYTGGCVEKTGFSVDAAAYKYLIVCLKGTAQYYIEIYDGTWKTVCAYPDAPSEYDVVTYDLSSITTGTVTGIRLGVYGGELKEALYDFAAFCSYQAQYVTDKVISLTVRQKESDVDEFELTGTNDIAGGLTIGRRIRIWLNGLNGARKVFAGVIEESIPQDRTGRVLFVSGRDFSQKILLRTKSKTFNTREVSLAVKDFVEDLSEVTTLQVETPSPTVNITKDYRYEYIMDGLKDLAKWAGSDWEVKLGMGHDLRFRSRQSGNVPSLPQQISESSGHILRGVRRASDGIRVFNKATVIGGPLYNHNGDPDAWTEATTGWSVTNGTISAAANGPVGSYYLYISFTDQNKVWCERTIPSMDLTKYKSLKLYCRHQITATADWNVWIQVGNNSSNYKSFPLKCLGGGEIPGDHLTELEIPLDHPGWSTTGSPDMTNVTYLCIHPGCISAGNISGTFEFDGFHFFKQNVTKSKSGTSDFRHTREYIYRDEKIVDPDFAQQVADALFAVLKSNENRYVLPLVGIPNVQVGYKADVDCPTHNLNGTYYIVEAEHRITPGEGYITVMVLEKPRLYLETLLAEAIERKIKLIERGRIE